MVSSTYHARKPAHATRCVCRQVNISSITTELASTMFELLRAHFHNVSRDIFERDLSSKSTVLLLEESESGRLLGFSTHRVLRSSSGARVVFSGDTIIDPIAWGSLALPKAWGAWMLSLSAEEPESPLYWMLISKGHRTFRFLPTYFIDYAPGLKRKYSSDELCMIREIGGFLFGDKLTVNQQGFMVVAHDISSQRLKEHLIDERHLRSHQRDIKFFANANLDYVHGSELVCVVNFTISNMRPFCRRMLGLRSGDMEERIHDS
jgi:hypothetical protein